MTTPVTVKDMIEVLQKLPQDAIVRVGREKICGYSAMMVYDDIDSNIHVHDFTDDKWKDSVFYGKKIIDLETQ